MSCAASEDSAQPRHPIEDKNLSLNLMCSLGSKPSGDTYAKSDLSLHWAYGSFVGYVVPRFINVMLPEWHRGNGSDKHIGRRSEATRGP